MATQPIVIGLSRDDRNEHITIEAERVERDRDGGLRAYDGDTEIGMFPDGVFAVHAEHFEG